MVIQQAILHLIPTLEKENKEKDLVEYKATLSETELEALVQNTKSLQKWQNSTDKKEDLEKIKSVNAKEVELKNPFEETFFEEYKGINFSHYDAVTNGISYSKLLFDISDFEVEQLQYASVLSYLLFNFNTKNKTEAEVIKEIGANLGGISSYVDVFRKHKSEECEVKFIISAKNLVEKAGELAKILDETTLNADFEDKEALYNVLLEIKLMLESRFKNSGHAFVARRISGFYNPQSKLASYHGEYDFYMFISELVSNYEQNSDKIKEQLYTVTNLIFNQARLLVNFVGNKEEYANFKETISSYLTKYPTELDKQKGIEIKLEDQGYSEGFYFDSLVQYVGVGYNINDYTGTHLVLRHILSLDYLWNNVRVKNGAYGSGVIFNAFGDFNLWSYRDPNLTETLEIYYNINNYVANINADEKDLNKYIIGTLNSLDVLMSPSAQAAYSLNKYITNSPFEVYDKLVNEIKNTTVEDLRKLAVEFENMKSKAYTCVLGSKEKVLENKQLFNKTIELKQKGA